MGCTVAVRKKNMTKKQKVAKDVEDERRVEMHST